MSRIGVCVGAGGVPAARVVACSGSGPGGSAVPRLGPCDDAPGPCVQPGPCCEPDPIGRCTPRSIIRHPDGSYTGAAPAALDAVVSVTGRVGVTKKKISFFDMIGVPVTWNLPVEFFGTGALTATMAADAPGANCAVYAGSGEAYRPPSEDTRVENVPRCGGPILPVILYERSLRADLEYSPAAGVGTGALAGPNGPGLARHTITLRVWDFEVDLTVWVNRTAGQHSGNLAKATARANVRVNASTSPPAAGIPGGWLPVDHPVAVALNPCGTSLEVRLVKGPLTEPYAPQGPDFCPPPVGLVDQDYCQLCTGVEYDLVFRIEMGDDFEACRRCDLVVESPCCGDGPGGSGVRLPEPETPPLGSPPGTPLRWLDTPMRGYWRQDVAETGTVPNGSTYRSVIEASLDLPLKWREGSCPVLACSENFSLAYTITSYIQGGGTQVTHGTDCLYGQIHQAGGGGGPTGDAVLALSLFGNSGAARFSIEWHADAANSRFLRPLPDSPAVPGVNQTFEVSGLRALSTARYRRLGVDQISGQVWDESFDVTVGPLHACTKPPPPGGGEPPEQLRGDAGATSTRAVAGECCGRAGVQGVRDVGM